MPERGAEHAASEGAERVVPFPSRLGSLVEHRELPQRGPGQNPGHQRILGIFHGLRSLLFLVETMHYWSKHQSCSNWPT